MPKNLTGGALIVLPALALLACGDQRNGATAEGPEAAFPEAEAPPPGQAQIAEARALEAYRLTTERIRQFADAYENLHQLEEADPGLQARLDAMAEAEFDDESGLEDVVSILEREPRVRAAIEDAGLTARDFVLIQATLVPAYMLVMMEEAGVPAPPDVTGVSEHHLEFVRENRAEIDAQMQRIQTFAGDDQAT